MILVRVCRTPLVMAVLFLAVWLVPSRVDAVSHHRSTRPRVCERVLNHCLVLKWHNQINRLRHTRHPDSDDAFEDFDDRDTRTDPTSNDTLEDEAASSADSDTTPPWTQAQGADEPRPAPLSVWRKLAAPRPPPSL